MAPHLSRIIPFVTLVALGACSGDDDPGDNLGDDAGNGRGDAGQVDAGADCLVAPSYASVGPEGFQASEYGEGGDRSVKAWVALDDGSPPDFLSFHVIGAGFDDGVVPGIYDLTNDGSCWACVEILGDPTDARPTGEQWFRATAGTLTLTSTEGSLAGSLTDVVFAGHALVDEETTRFERIGCATSLGSATFDVDLDDGA